LVGVILILPAILTIKGVWLDFSDTGEIGDTIGGIMGPFVGIPLVVGWFTFYYSSS
jgi:hypothetical protein